MPIILSQVSRLALAAASASSDFRAPPRCNSALLGQSSAISWLAPRRKARDALPQPPRLPPQPSTPGISGKAALSRSIDARSLGSVQPFGLSQPILSHRLGICRPCVAFSGGLNGPVASSGTIHPNAKSVRLMNPALRAHSGN